MASVHQLHEREAGRGGRKISMHQTAMRYFGPLSSFEPDSPGGISAVYNVEWSPSGQYCVCCLKNGFATIVDTRSWKGVGTLHGHTESVNVARFRDEHTVFTGSDDTTARQWDLRMLSSSEVVSQGAAVAAAQLEAQGFVTHAAAVSERHHALPDSQSRDSCVRVYRGHSRWVKNTEPVCGDFLLTFAYDGCVLLWDTRADAPETGVPLDSRDCCMANPAIWLQRGCLKPPPANTVFYHPQLSRITVHSDVMGSGRNAKLALAVGDAAIIVHNLSPRSLAPALDRAWNAFPVVSDSSYILASAGINWVHELAASEFKSCIVPDGDDHRNPLERSIRRKLNGLAAADRCSPVRAAAALKADLQSLTSDNGTFVADSGTCVADSGTCVADSGTCVADSGTCVVASDGVMATERNIVELQHIGTAGSITSMRFNTIGSRLTVARCEGELLTSSPALGEAECLVLDTSDIPGDIPDKHSSATDLPTQAGSAASSDTTAASSGATAASPGDGFWVETANAAECPDAPLDIDSSATMKTDCKALLVRWGFDGEEAVTMLEECSQQLKEWHEKEVTLTAPCDTHAPRRVWAGSQCRERDVGFGICHILHNARSGDLGQPIEAFWQAAAPVSWSALLARDGMIPRALVSTPQDGGLLWSVAIAPLTMGLALSAMHRVAETIAWRPELRPLDWMDPVARPVRVASRCFVKWICSNRPSGIIKGPDINAAGTVAALPNGATVMLLGLERAHQHWLQTGEQLQCVMPGSEVRASGPTSIATVVSAVASVRVKPAPGRTCQPGCKQFVTRLPMWVVSGATESRLVAPVPGLDLSSPEPLPGLGTSYIRCDVPAYRFCRSGADPQASLISLDPNILAVIPSEQAGPTEGSTPSSTSPLPAASVLTARFEPASRGGDGIPRLLLTLNSGQVTVAGHMSDTSSLTRA